MTFEQLFSKMMDGTLNAQEKQEMILYARGIGDTLSLVKNWVSTDNGIRQTAIPFPLFPLIASEPFVEDKSELIVEIPESYNHLFILGMAKTTNATNTLLKAQLNGDSGANYSVQRMSSALTVVSAQDSSTDTSFHIGPMIAAGADAGEGGHFAVFMPHYKSSFYKSGVSIEGTFRLNAPSASSNALFASQWRNQAVLKKMRFFCLAGNIKAGSLISIYGIT